MAELGDYSEGCMPGEKLPRMPPAASQGTEHASARPQVDKAKGKHFFPFHIQNSAPGDLRGKTRLVP